MCRLCRTVLRLLVHGPPSFLIVAKSSFWICFFSWLCNTNMISVPVWAYPSSSSLCSNMISSWSSPLLVLSWVMLPQRAGGFSVALSEDYPHIAVVSHLQLLSANHVWLAAVALRPCTCFLLPPSLWPKYVGQLHTCGNIGQVSK